MAWSIASAILFLKPDLNLFTFMVSVVTATVVLGRIFDLRHLPGTGDVFVHLHLQADPPDEEAPAGVDPEVLVQRRSLAGGGRRPRVRFRPPPLAQLSYRRS